MPGLGGGGGRAPPLVSPLLGPLYSLLDISNFFGWKVQFFAKFGGINCYALVRRCLAPIIEDSVAEQFSFLGKKGKNTFGTTFLAKAIIGKYIKLFYYS